MNFNFWKRKRIATTTQVCITCAFLSSSISVCNPRPLANAVENKPDRVTECDSAVPFRRPDGSETILETNAFDRGEVEITVRNVSDGPIFAAFSADGEGTATYLAHSVEIADKSGRFSSRSGEEDYVPSLRSLASGAEIRYKYVEPFPGLYRVRIRYLVDPQPLSLLNNPGCLFKLSTETSTRIRNAWKEITSAPFKVSTARKHN